MTTRSMVSAGAAGALAVMFSVASHGQMSPEGKKSAATPAPAGAKAPTKTATAYKAPRTPWGDPDLQGIWQNNDEILTPLEKPAAGAKTFATIDEALTEADERGGATGAGPKDWYETKPSTGRVALLIDPPDQRLPARTPWAQEQQASIRGKNNDSYIYMSPTVRCLAKGVPGGLFPNGFMYNNAYQIIQTRKNIIIRLEMIHDMRIIPMDGRPHAGTDVRFWLGDPRGHWDGDTLVVESTNFLPHAPMVGFQTSAVGGAETMRVIERFTRVAAKTITYRATVEAPKVFTKPFTLEVPMRRDDEYVIFEYACHEGNKAIVNILSGARAEEKAAAAKP